MVQAFLKQSCQENDKPLRELTSDAMNRLMEYPWPGNVRELRAAVDHGVVLATGPKITLRDLPAAVRPWTADGAGMVPAVHAGPVGIAGGNITEAAAMLGMSRRTLHRKLKQMNGPAAPGE